FEALQARHEVLRTVFLEGTSGPIQRINEQMPVDFSVVDAPADSDVLEKMVVGEAAKPFDLAKGPVYRCLIIRMQPNEYVIVLTLHHIVSDMVSAGILFKDLSAFYRAKIGSSSADLPELPVQYADYAAWQRDCFAKGLLAGQVEYWRQQLKDAPAYLEVPLDNPRPALPTFLRGFVPLAVSKDTFEQIGKLCREENATPFMFFMAAYMHLLGKHANRKDILVGTDVLNRDRSETANLIGFFVNQLVFRADLAQSATFRELLRQVRDTAFEAYAHQDLPFDQLVEQLRPARDRERPPFYQVKLAYGTGAPAAPDLEGVQVRREPRVRDTAQLDLTLFLNESAGSVTGELEYRAELYRPETIARIVADYEAMIRSFAGDPNAALDTQPGPAPTAQDRKKANRAKLLGGL
ncbi:MAG TPA: condensation domain-containing protein, partial [Capsulimonadaceae bacterium]|nr:condensation domain-containing protein [Capsulimonadaceae bacterium]